MNVESVDIQSLRPTEKKRHPKIVSAAVKLLRNGWDIQVVPPLLVVIRGDGVYILNGHQRWKAAQKLGLEKVPVVDREAMTRGDVASYTSAVRRYRKLIGHPLNR